MADSDYSSKGSTKVEEKFKGTNWPTFGLEVKFIFYHLRVDELITIGSQSLLGRLMPRLLKG